ncbi:RHS repeat-associated core domain-containing protein, partial [Flavobacterium branchiophilum]|uniref:RHS repeat protein n=2 Tax=Flavobacterium branchiophilum TaxID=55197 RepID=UPI0039EE0484
ILFGNSNYITYLYTASGQKMEKIVYENNDRTTTDYINGFQYKTLPSGDGGLVFFPHAEGYVNVNESYKLTESSLYNYVFNYTDHLGNISMSYTQAPTGSLSILEENHYYPFGLKHTNYNSDKRLYVRESVASKIKPVTPLFPLVYNYKYNGKEWQDELGLNMYDYGARMYDPARAGWSNIDPLTEKMRRFSPYNYCFNNPLRFTDPDGMAPTDWVLGQDNKIRWDNNANSQATTKSGEIYLGKTLTFNFNSYIDNKLWDGPMGDSPAGDKLTTTVSLTGNENEKGELTSISATKSVKVGDTPIGTSNGFYPGDGGSNNVLTATSTSTGVNVNMEQHASVSPIEELGMNLMGYKIVDVAQKLSINYNSNNKSLSIDAYTGIFPSSTLTMTANQGFVNHQMMQYNQPSFVKTHTAPSTDPGTSYLPGSAKKYDFSYYPTKFYKR